MRDIHLYVSTCLKRSLIERFSGIAQVAIGKQDDWPRNQQVLQGHTNSVNSVAFSPNGRYIVSGSWDKTI